MTMDPGYRSPLVDQFRRGDTPREMKVLAAQGGLAATAHEQLALLLLLSDDPDREVAATVKATIEALPTEPLRAFLARADAPAEMKPFFSSWASVPRRSRRPTRHRLLDDDGRRRGRTETERGSAARTRPTRRSSPVCRSRRRSSWPSRAHGSSGLS